MAAINAINSSAQGYSRANVMDKGLGAQPIKPQVAFGRKDCSDCCDKESKLSSGVTIVSLLAVGAALGALLTSVLTKKPKAKDTVKVVGEKIEKSKLVEIITDTKLAMLNTIKKAAGLRNSERKNNKLNDLFIKMNKVGEDGQPTQEALNAAHKIWKQLGDLFLEKLPTR